MEQTHSEMSGSARNVVQAGTISGGIHFAAPPASKSRPGLLPANVRGFVNRTRELDSLDKVLESGKDGDPVRIVLLVGTAGVGKTSVAVRWAHKIRDRFPDGQLYVNLHGYDAGEPLSALTALERFLRVLDVAPERMPAEVEARADMFRSLIAERRLLVVLDNAATADQVRPLLPGSDTCLVLITSRSRLSGLVARDGARRIDVDTLASEASMALLRKVITDYRGEDTDDELADLARLCANLPLALRIAAERAAARPWLPLAELINELRDESGLWHALSTDDEAEADAVRSVFAWSYRALPESAARVFRLLGLHPGPEFSLNAAAALAGATPSETRRALDALLNAHLLEQIGRERYQFHDLLRAYAADQARQEEPEDVSRACIHRLLGWYLSAAASARPRDPIPPFDIEPVDQAAELPVLDTAERTRGWYQAERANLMAAAKVAAALGLDRIAWQIPALVQEIAVAVDPVDTWAEGKLAGLEAARRLGDANGEGVMLLCLAIGDRYAGRLEAARERYLAAAEKFTAAGSLPGEIQALNGLGLVLLRFRNLDAADLYFSQALEAARQLADPFSTMLALMNLGHTRGELGDAAKAEQLVTEAIALASQLGDAGNEAAALRVLATIHRSAGSATRARQAVDKALALCQDVGNRHTEAYVLLESANIDHAEGKLAEALNASHAAGSAFRSLGSQDQEAEAWRLAGTVYSQLGRHDEGVALLDRAAAVHRQLEREWPLALDLISLAEAQDRAGETRAARVARREAYDLLAAFTDPVATALRAEIDVESDG